MVTVLCRSLGKQCGVSEYSKILTDRLGAKLVSRIKDIDESEQIVFIEFEHSLYGSVSELARETFSIPARFIVIDDHSDIQGIEFFGIHANKHRWHPDTVYLPLVGYRNVESIKPNPNGSIRLGSFGFAMPHKKYEEIIDLAERLNVPLTLLASVANATEETATSSKDYLQFLRERAGPKVNIISRFLSQAQIISELQKCSHLISAMINVGDRTSGSLRVMSLAGRPVVSLPCHAANEIGIAQVNSLDDITLGYLKSLRHIPISDMFDTYTNLIHWLETAISYEPQVLHHDGLYLDDVRQMERVAWLRDRVDGRAVDVGIGNGWTTNFMWCDAGIESRWDRTAYAAIRYPHIRFYCMDASRQAISGFDTVVLAEIIEHMSFEDAWEMVNLWALTSPKKILITTPNAAKDNYDPSLVHTSEHMWFPIPKDVEKLCPNGYYWHEFGTTSGEDFIIGELCRKQ